MFETIIWATDGSEAADEALPFAKALAACGGGALVVVHTREPLYTGRAAGLPAYADESDVEAKIAGQVDELETEGYHATLNLATGTTAHAAHAIATIASDVGAGVIVVGTRGHGPLTGYIVGSVTQRLLHVAPCPVVAVPTAEQRQRRREEGRALAGSRT
jgi:nucleotide-binding universal stress UspA family protein